MTSSSFFTEDLFLQLPRPEYVPLPEGFLSAIAWRAYSPDVVSGADPAKKVGLRFRPHPNAAKSGRTVEYVPTVPSGEVLKQFSKNLELSGLVQIGTDGNLGLAVINSITGTETERSKFLPSVPLSPAIAILQNPVGLAGKANPPDLANILETIYLLGSKGMPEQTLCQRYVAASEVRLASDPILAAINQAFVSTVWAGDVAPAVIPAYDRVPTIQTWLIDTPFGWFHDAWNKVTSEAWVLALPSRVWVDWASSVLRMGFALSYLWEAAWYENLGRTLLDFDIQSAAFENSLISSMDGTLPWKSSRVSMDIRDVSSKLKWRCFRAVAVRKVLEDWVAENGAAKWGVPEFVEAARGDLSLLEQIQKSLSSAKSNTSGSGKNLWEAIRYSLQSRERGDHYGLLNSRGNRYLFTDPGIEWAAMMASLSSAGPGYGTDLGEIFKSLVTLGITPDATDLLQLLEKTGLARGAADADFALEVDSAYGGA